MDVKKFPFMKVIEISNLFAPMFCSHKHAYLTGIPFMGGVFYKFNFNVIHF